jgi:PAS domain S-box-containing protein
VTNGNSAPLEKATSERELVTRLESLGQEAALSVLTDLASALFPAGVGRLEQVTWTDAERQRPARPLPTTVDERDQAATRLKTAELRYRTLVEQIPAVTFMAVLGEGENEVYVSPYIEALLGFTQQEWLENPFLWYSQLHPDDRALWYEEFARGCRTGGPFRAECRLIARDGHIVWVRGEARLIKDEVGRPLFLQGVAYDITESKKAEAAILQAAVRTIEERYRDLVERLGAIFWEAEARTGRFIFVSRGAEQLLGFSPERWLADPQFWINQVDPGDRERVTAEWRRVLDVGADHEFEFRAAAADGRVLWLHNRAHVASTIDGDLRVLGVIFDVTDRKRAEVDLEHALAVAEAANRTKDEFLATMSHELRTPLNAVLGWTQILRTESLQKFSRNRALESIDRNARAQAQIIDDLLDVSRIITGKLQLEVKAVDLLTVIEAAIDASQLAADAKRIHLVRVWDRSAAIVAGDGNRLLQVVNNLLTNAVKFTHQEGRVEIRLEREGGIARIRVIDNGQGISQAFLPHVFDRFRQADSSTTRVHGGLGLGLAIVRHLIELHGGTVRAQSAGIGRGATFTIELPLSAYEEEIVGASEVRSPAACATTPDLSRPLQGTRIVVADDDADSRALISRILTRAGAKVTTTSSVRGAIRAFKRIRPDVLVTDIGMPEEDGFDLLRQVRALENGGRQTPAVAVTAYAGSGNKERILAGGFQAHVSKPMSADELLAAVEQLVRSNRGG